MLRAPVLIEIYAGGRDSFPMVMLTRAMIVARVIVRSSTSRLGKTADSLPLIAPRKQQEEYRQEY
jgi:hypothetical protein